MVAKLLRRLAGRSAPASGNGETMVMQTQSVERGDRSGAAGHPLPSAWVKMRVWRRDQGRCALCRGQESAWFGYVVPPWEGGRVTEENILLMCERCHRSNAGARTRRTPWRP